MTTAHQTFGTEHTQSILTPFTAIFDHLRQKTDGRLLFQDLQVIVGARAVFLIATTTFFCDRSPRSRRKKPIFIRKYSSMILT